MRLKALISTQAVVGLRITEMHLKYTLVYVSLDTFLLFLFVKTNETNLASHRHKWAKYELWVLCVPVFFNCLLAAWTESQPLGIPIDALVVVVLGGDDGKFCTSCCVKYPSINHVITFYFSLVVLNPMRVCNATTSSHFERAFRFR